MPLDRQTIAHDPIHEQHLGHGNTVASWAMFTIMFVGFLLSCVAFTIPNWVLFLGRRRDLRCRYHRRRRSESRRFRRGWLPHQARLTL